MESELKTGICSTSLWWKIALVFQGFFIAMMGGTFCSRHWVYSEFSENFNKADYNITVNSYTGTFYGKDFAGRFDRCRIGCGSTYRQEASEWCDIYNEIKSNTEYSNVNCTELYSSQSLCSLFSTLNKGFIVYLILELLAALTAIVWIIVTIQFIRFRRFMIIGFLLGALAVIFHYGAMISWIEITDANFNYTCDIFPTDGSLPVVCASRAPIVGICNMIYSVLILVAYIVLAYKFNKLKRNQVYVLPKSSNGEGISIDQSNYNVTARPDATGRPSASVMPLTKNYNPNETVLEYSNINQGFSRNPSIDQSNLDESYFQSPEIEINSPEEGIVNSPEEEEDDDDEDDEESQEKIEEKSQLDYKLNAK
jgi:hypothetical protein